MAEEGAFGLSQEKINRIVLQRFKNNRFGTELKLSNTNFHNDYIPPLVELIRTRTHTRKLTSIELAANEFTWVGMKPLCEVLSSKSPYDMLVHLDVSNNALCDPGVILIAKALRKNTTLTSLIISNCHCDDAGAAALGRALHVNKTLEALSVDRNAFLEINHSPRGKFR